MRVLNIVFDDRFGGPQNRVIQVASALREHGVETVLCLPKGDGTAAQVATEAGVEVRRVDFGRIPRLSRPNRVLKWAALVPRDVLRFKDLLRAERPDVVHVNGVFFATPAIASRLMKVPMVWHVNDTLVGPGLARVLGVMVQLLASQVVVSARAVARHYRLSEGYKVLYPPVDTNLYQPVHGGIRDSGPHRVGLVGNWSPVKGVEYFVQSAALLRERVPQVHQERGLEFVFAGRKLATQSRYCEGVESLIDQLGLRPAIRDHGFVSPLTGVLAELDVLVLSSTSEASPMVVLEGMAAGVPIVATDVGGVRELVTPDPACPAGIVVRPRDPAAIASAVSELLDNPQQAQWMGQNGRRLAEERFSLERCAQEHLDIYATLASGKGKATVPGS